MENKNPKRRRSNPNGDTKHFTIPTKKKPPVIPPPRKAVPVIPASKVSPNTEALNKLNPNALETKQKIQPLNDKRAEVILKRLDYLLGYINNIPYLQYNV